MRILLIEDERRLANVMKKGLTEEGFALDIAYDAQDVHPYLPLCPPLCPPLELTRA
jgi:DNA-binding response OmpR family regulator